jgi:DNA repair exonuclease SbcCD ATPase subunit
MGRLDDFEARWHQETLAILTGMKEWRLQHPRATFREMETAVDERLNQAQARLLADLTLASQAAALSGLPAEERPPCPTCGGPLEPLGNHEREVLTQGGQRVSLEREYASCQACGAGLFPPE